MADILLQMTAITCFQKGWNKMHFDNDMIKKKEGQSAKLASIKTRMKQTCYKLAHRMHKVTLILLKMYPAIA